MTGGGAERRIGVDYALRKICREGDGSTEEGFNYHA